MRVLVVGDTAIGKHVLAEALSGRVDVLLVSPDNLEYPKFKQDELFLIQPGPTVSLEYPSNSNEKPTCKKHHEYVNGFCRFCKRKVSS